MAYSFITFLRPYLRIDFRRNKFLVLLQIRYPNNQKIIFLKRIKNYQMKNYLLTFKQYENIIKYLYFRKTLIKDHASIK